MADGSDPIIHLPPHEEITRDVAAFFDEAASMCVGALRCATCGHEETVDPLKARHYLQHGWPECHGNTMRLEVEDGG